uniref:Uncharacterized protein n=2 Tax=Cacopsylla melanoneura TaxID=428564 RepID=A0A8D8WW31_9HEMI
MLQHPLNPRTFHLQLNPPMLQHQHNPLILSLLRSLHTLQLRLHPIFPLILPLRMQVVLLSPNTAATTTHPQSLITPLYPQPSLLTQATPMTIISTRKLLYLTMRSLLNSPRTLALPQSLLPFPLRTICSQEVKFNVR